MLLTEPEDTFDDAPHKNQDAETHGQDATLQMVEGTIQRVNYRTRQLRIIAEGHPWEFVLANNCQLWFYGRIVPFRCFQPLDHVKILFVDDGSVLVTEALYLCVEEPIHAKCHEDGSFHDLEAST